MVASSPKKETLARNTRARVQRRRACAAAPAAPTAAAELVAARCAALPSPPTLQSFTVKDSTTGRFVNRRKSDSPTRKSGGSCRSRKRHCRHVASRASAPREITRRPGAEGRRPAAPAARRDRRPPVRPRPRRTAGFRLPGPPEAMTPGRRRRTRRG